MIDHFDPRAPSRILIEEPYIHSKEPYRHSKEPCILSKEPYIHSKEPYTLAKQRKIEEQIHDSYGLVCWICPATLHINVDLICSHFDLSMYCSPSTSCACRFFSRKRATNYRALLRIMTYKDKASYGSSSPCRTRVYIETHI